jgi:aryl-alcohol dehydrogenase-like predicted oxidoreductase
MQNFINLLYREEEREMNPLCRAEGVGLIPWSPLARGKLTRDWDDASTERSQNDPFGASLFAKTEEADRRIVTRVAEIAAARGVSRAQIALAWLLAKPGVTAPIVGATRARHLEDAIAAAALTLTQDEITRLEELYVPHPVTGFA